MRTIRINNIEFKYSELNKKYEIVKWFPNEFYSKEGDFDYNSDKNSYTYKLGDNRSGWCWISPDCFKNPESCFVIAFFDVVKDGDPDLRWCGKRPLDLDESEFSDFMMVVRLAYDEFNNSKDENIQ